MNKQNIKQYQKLSIQEQEYLKDVWDVRIFGIASAIENYSYKISFKKIRQGWLKESAKAYARYALTVLSYATVKHTITAVNRLCLFIEERCLILHSEQIDRQFIVNFLAYMAEAYPNSSSRQTRITLINSFLQLCQREKWLSLSNEILIYKEDYPGLPKFVPRYIPGEVINQLNEHINALPRQVARIPASSRSRNASF